MLFERISK
jgi:hypothetical protein